MNPKPKQLAFVVVLILIVGSIYYLQSQKVDTGFVAVPGSSDIAPRGEVENSASSTQTISPIPVVKVSEEDKMTIENKKKQYELAKEISTPDYFINTDSSFTIKKLIGKKIILVDFWTYSCINCQRTQPYLNAWYEKYKDKGLEIVGVHTPEFEFEKKIENVQNAVTKEQIKYPVVLDNDFSTWRAYENQYWPRKYLIDIDGFIVYDRIGEGAYEETERKIQELLAERMKVLDEQGSIASDIARPENAVQVDSSKPLSRETYFGSARNEFFANGKKHTPGVQTLVVPALSAPNSLYLGGEWNITPEFAENKTAGKIVYRYSGKNVYLVANVDGGADVKIVLDGKTVRDILHIEAYDLYHIIAGTDYGTHTLEIIIDKPGLRAFAFTFG
ncbi:MAG: redoxin family protein [Patescibacteria group bacterium]